MYLGFEISWWDLILTTLLLPEPPRSSPASSCRPEAGPELAALGPETATPETVENVERSCILLEFLN